MSSCLGRGSAGGATGDGGSRCVRGLCPRKVGALKSPESACLFRLALLLLLATLLLGVAFVAVSGNVLCTVGALAILGVFLRLFRFETIVTVGVGDIVWLTITDGRPGKEGCFFG